jgi:DNA-binding NarL/FixJ family response regulator
METAIPAARNKVFIVEDSAQIRERLHALLDGVQGVSVVGEADSAGSAIDGILGTHPDAVLLDIQLSAGTGIDVMRKVHPQAPDIVFIVLTSHTLPQYRKACMDSGASYFLDKDAEFARVPGLLRKLGAPPLARMRE